jgi:S1-C subfamily serine protease
VQQLAKLIGILLGIVVAAYIYSSLAFLTENSVIKIIVLALLIAAATFLSYDVFATLGRRVQRLSWVKKITDTIPDRIGSAVVTSVGVVVLFWFLSVAIVSALPTEIRSAVKQSRILSTASASIPTPPFLASVSQLLTPFSAPEIFIGSEPDLAVTATSITQEYEQLDAAITKTTPSIVKINTWGCGSVGAGSGFIAGSNLIVTNAHVVAGVDRMSIQTRDGAVHLARAAWFDPSLDVAVLATEQNLEYPALGLRTSATPAGSIGAALGYPGGGDFVATDVTLLSQLNAEGYDIYQKNKIVRSIYAVRGEIIPGNSGGPLIDASGAVAGVVVGHSTSNSRIGYAIVASQVASGLKSASQTNASASVGSCVGN